MKDGWKTMEQKNWPDRKPYRDKCREMMRNCRPGDFGYDSVVRLYERFETQIWITNTERDRIDMWYSAYSDEAQRAMCEEYAITDMAVIT